MLQGNKLESVKGEHLLFVVGELVLHLVYFTIVLAFEKGVTSC